MATKLGRMVTYLEGLLTIERGTIIQTGITCKKIPCMLDSVCRWGIVKTATIF